MAEAETDKTADVFGWSIFRTWRCQFEYPDTDSRYVAVDVAGESERMIGFELAGIQEVGEAVQDSLRCFSTLGGVADDGEDRMRIWNRPGAIADLATELRHIVVDHEDRALRNVVEYPLPDLP